MIDIIEEALGGRVKFLRESRGMSQEELGAILGLNKRAVEGIESGRSSNIRADKIKLLCETFHEYPGFLLYGHGHGYWERLLNSKARPESSPADALNGGSILLMIRKAVEETLGSEGVSLLNNIRQLNEAGQIRAKTLIDDLLKISEYRKGT